MFILIWTTNTRISKAFQITAIYMVGIVDGNTLMLCNTDILFNMVSVKDINPFYLSLGSPGPK